MPAGRVAAGAAAVRVATWQGPRPAFQAEEVVRAPQDGQPLLVVGQLQGAVGVRQIQDLQPPHSTCQMPKTRSFLPTSFEHW